MAEPRPQALQFLPCSFLMFHTDIKKLGERAGGQVHSHTIITIIIMLVDFTFIGDQSTESTN